MRVRHLQSHLADQHLIAKDKMEKLKGLKIGIDAVYWLRSIQALKDPFADALGGVPPGIFGFVEKEVESFRKSGITPFFIFQGIAPGPQHSMFISRMDQQMENAWSCLARGQKSEAQKCFAVSTSRINGDFVYFIFHHLRQKGCEVLMAPYFAGAQLAHFANNNVVQAVFGPPGLLLYDVRMVVISLDFAAQSFEWVDLTSILKKWGITKDQFVDACMLAGTEYCLTYPYLNVGQPQQGQQRFNFEVAVDFIKKGPIINFMNNFPTDTMKRDHVDGYCTCKVLVQSSPVLQSGDCDVRPMGSSGVPTSTNGTCVPKDFSEIMGEKLPNSLYYLMMQGVISHKIPQALARGEWVDKSQPLVDSVSFRSLLEELQDYRSKSVRLVSKHLHKSFSKKAILYKAFHHAEKSQSAAQPLELDRSPLPQLRWTVNKEQLQKEKIRQNATEVDLKFCLRWHRHEFDEDGQWFKDLRTKGEPSCSEDQDCLSALVHFMLLEHLEYIGSDGEGTQFGEFLKDCPKHLMEPCLVALELLKNGSLNSDPFEPVQDKRFPLEIMYPTAQTITAEKKSIFLLTRVMSLIPMRLKTDMWNADVVFDLAAFHSMVRILKRSLRQLTEASLASVLMKDLKRVKLLPQGFLCSSPRKEDHLLSMGLLPTFMLPRTCMGIVVEHFLNSKHTDPARFMQDLQHRFPCCIHLRADLLQAFVFWEEIGRMMKTFEESIPELYEDFQNASVMLKSQQKKLGLVPDASILRGDEHESVKAKFEWKA